MHTAFDFLSQQAKGIVFPLYPLKVECFFTYLIIRKTSFYHKMIPSENAFPVCIKW